MLNKINSKYILQTIISCLSSRNILLIFKNNKNLQKSLEITKNDYIKYNQIEIDIIPIEFEKSTNKEVIINYLSKEKAYY